MRGFNMVIDAGCWSALLSNKESETLHVIRTFAIPKIEMSYTACSTRTTRMKKTKTKDLGNIEYVRC